jgi:hypothetical protein
MYRETRLPAVILFGASVIEMRRFVNGSIFYSQALGKKIFPRLGYKKMRFIEAHLCREDGIRTHDAVTHIQTFQACSFNHSDTSLVTVQRTRKKVCFESKKIRI